MAEHARRATPADRRRVPLVLVVDDYEDTRDLYAEFLKHAGFRVDTAEDGEQAIAKARALRPDLIVMDMTMPKVDGLQATRVLRADPATRDIVIIALSGAALPEHGRAAYESGCDEYLTKPLSPHALANAVKHALACDEDAQRTGRHPRRQ